MLLRLQSAITYVYCMEIPEILWWGLLLTVAFLEVFRRYQNERWMQYFVRAAFVCCIAVAIFATVGNRSDDHSVQLKLIPFHSYREVLAGGNPEIYRSSFMNAALFYPAGMLAMILLPKKWPGWCKCILVATLLAALSAGIEYVQYRYALGVCEIDDVIHNTAGALVGSLATLGIPPILCRVGKLLTQK